MKQSTISILAFWAAVVAGSENPDFDHLRQSVIRIQAVAGSFDWLHPFMPGSDGVGLGSGFVAQVEPYPLFVTNEHVINDAKQVTLQLLLYGEHAWEAEVVSVCPKFDLALLVLREPEAFKKAMTERNITLQAVKLADRVAAMGEDVVALGFPLGQDSLKISKGNVAGNEDVDGNICIQSTAPISPGSSGGPLFDAKAREVVGVNFAKATEGENINYVIPAWRVSQLVRKHLKDQPSQPADMQWKRIHVQVPEPELTTVEPNKALYTYSGGCSQGVYVAKVGERSMLRKARPEVPAGSFLTAVNGIELDRFGMGLNRGYAADRVSFSDLFSMIPDLFSDVEIQTCYQGKPVRHNVSMAWSPEYERGIRFVAEPMIDGMASKYELFGDISVMEMTVNHISTILSTSGDAGPVRWLHPDLVAQPRLIVNFVRQGSYVSDVLSVGSAVTKVNGHETRTLKEFREHFEPSGAHGGVWTLETDMGEVAALMFNESLVEQLTQAHSMNMPYLLTPSVLGTAKKLGFVSVNDGESDVSAKASTEETEKPALRASVKRHSALVSARQVTASADLPRVAAGPLVAQRQGAARVTRPGAGLKLTA
jgi:S1-C subfamily serine protease